MSLRKLKNQKIPHDIQMLGKRNDILIQSVYEHNMLSKDVYGGVSLIDGEGCKLSRTKAKKKNEEKLYYPLPRKNRLVEASEEFGSSL